MFIAALFIIARNGDSINVHQLMNGKTKWDIAIQWNIIHPQKGMNHWFMLQHWWSLKAYTEWKKPDTKGHIVVWLLSLYERSRLDKSRKREDKPVVREWKNRGEWRGSEWPGFLFGGDENVLKFSSGNGCEWYNLANVNNNKKPKTHCIVHFKRVYFMVCELHFNIQISIDYLDIT